MSNYPPGMTREHWRHIDGEIHYRACPAHEDHDVGGECTCDEIVAEQAEEYKRKKEKYNAKDN